MLTACIRDGKTFQRGEIEHLTSEGAVRNLGVTISPIYRAARASGKSGVAVARRKLKDLRAQDMKISGALCLMSDLTELTALQKQIRWKENLAALGEMSAGIAHEFKNSLATISGYAQMIRSESESGRRARVVRTHPGADARADSRGHGIPALRETAGNLLRDGADADRGRKSGGGAARNHSAMCRSSSKARSRICRATKRCCGKPC